MIGRVYSRLGILAAAALFGLAVSVGPMHAAGDPDGTRGPTTPPPKGGDQTSTDKKKKKKTQQELRDGYQQARALVLDGKYQEAIVAFKALDQDDHPEVANYLGYASRKLGDYQAAKVWYERALASDPEHVRTWQYYGMWHVEQGNMLKAQDFLETIRAICGTECKEYQDLKGGIEGTVSY